MNLCCNKKNETAFFGAWLRSRTLFIYGKHGGDTESIEFSVAYEEYLSRKCTRTALAEKLSITRPTLDKILIKQGLI